jgi:hypothetical protein
MISYPGSTTKTLSKDISDHSPGFISILTDIPKAKKIRFENNWMLHDDFMQIMEHGWNLPNNQTDKEKRKGLKLKNLRTVFRQCQGQMENLANVIDNNKRNTRN